MMSNAFLGIVLHAIGGFAAGSFYLPIKKVKEWSWESAWLVNGLFSWLLVPIIVALLTIENSYSIILNASNSTLIITYIFGILWGIGGLTFGLTMRHLGMSLGMAVALGLTAAFGTLIPPIYKGEFLNLIQTQSGKIVLGGILVALIGILVCGRAGMLREISTKIASKKSGDNAFNLRKGLIVALVAGILSACFAFGLEAGKPLATEAVKLGGNPLWQNNPVLVVILLGGLTTNVVWCVILNIKNKSYTDYTSKSTPLFKNYIFAALAGITWYCQFLFYGMGSTKMGEEDFASWTLHMVFIIVFSSFWGLVTGEWKGVSKRTIYYLATGLGILILSSVIIGWGNNI